MKPEKKSLNYIDLVPKLIKNSKGLSKELKNRIQSNKLFSEFDYKASNEFNFFIKESEKRHLGSKYGTKIDFILKASKKRGEKEAYKILNDKLYTDKELINERKKMLKKSTNEVHDNITSIIKQIKEIKNNSYWSNHNDKKKINMKKSVKKFNEGDDNILIQDKNMLNIKMNEINNIFNKEQKKIKIFFDDYKKYLSERSKIPNNKKNQDIQNDKKENDNKNNTIENKKNYSKKNFILPKMQLLNYTKSFTHIKTKKDIDDENRIDLKKLKQYSTSGKDIKLIQKNKKICLTNPNVKNWDDFLETKYTNTVVLQKAFNEYGTFRNKFMNKNETIQKKLGINKIPSLKEYETLITNNFNDVKRKRRFMNKIMAEKQKYLGKNNREIMNEKIQENLFFLNNYENILRKRKNFVTI